MGFRGGYGGGYGRGYGFGRGYGLGYGRGFGGRYYYGDPTRCARFPWLPRWWWANPSYSGAYSTMPSSTLMGPVSPYLPVPEEKAYLEEQIKYLEKELADIRNRYNELKSAETT